MNKVIVRLSIFLISFYFMYVIFQALNGIDVSNDLFRFVLEYSFFLLVRDSPKYHCRYARFLALNVFITDSFTYLDSIFNIIPDAETFLYVLSASWLLAVSATIYLAIRHFIKVRSLRREKNRYEEFKLK